MSSSKSAFSAVRWTTASTIGKTFLQFIQVIVLARLLTPGDFGLMAIVLTVVTFLQGLSDLGLSSAIIHHQDTSERELSGLYWLNLAVASSMSLIIAACSPLVAWFYGDPRLTNMLALAGFTLAASAIGQQLRVRAERALNFMPLAIIELSSASIGLAAAALVAFHTRSALALVVGLLASAISLSVLSWRFLSHGWRPMRTFCLADTRRLISFGGYASISNVVGMINMQLDVAIGGRIFEASELGAYSMARDLSLRLASITNPIFTRVGFPLMAQQHHEKENVCRVYGRILEILSALNFPLYLGVAFFSTEIIQVFFGSHWEAAAPLLSFMAIWGMLRSMMNPVGSLLYACGQAKKAFQWNVSLFFLSLPSVLIGCQWGTKGLVLAQVCLMLFVFNFAWKYLIQPDTGMTLHSYLSRFLPSLALSCVTVLICWLSVIPFNRSDTRLGLAFLMACIIYPTISWYWNRSWMNSIRDVIRKV